MYAANSLPQFASTTPLALPRPMYSGLSLDNRVRYRAQSVLTAIMPRPEIPTLWEAREILRWADQKGPVK